MPEPKRDDIISLKKLREHLEEMLARVNDSKDPMYTWVPGHGGIAIVDLEEFAELRRLADKGLIAEIVEVAERADAEGGGVPWRVVKEEWERGDEEWEREEEQKRREHG